MSIRIRCDRQFSASALATLFLSADWMSGDYPEELRRALQGAHTVYTAWDDGQLVGLCSTLADGVMTVYVNYMVVLPAYQGKGLGGLLLRLVLRKYEGYRRWILLADEQKTGFYRRFGFQADRHAQPMAKIRTDARPKR